MLVTPRWVRRGAVAAAALFSLPLGAQAQHEHSASPPTATVSADRPATHGMLVFGTEAVYASHLPMFHAPHHYQLVVELTLSDSARAAYAASRRAFPAEAVYTLEPERFVLPDMVGHPRPFRATLYRGHFERGGVPVAGAQQVSIRRVLLFRPLDAAQAPAAQAPGLLVGNGREQFLLHRIEGRPDFDQVLRVGVADRRLRQRLRRQGLLPWQRAGANNRQPLPTGQTLTGRLTDGPALPLPVLEQLYLEFDDLK